jgi:hypothetical protein
MKLKYILLILPILIWVGCEDKDSEVDCTTLTTTSDEASLAYSTAVANAPAEDHSELCSDNADAYQAGLDGSCSGFDQAGLDEIQTACGDTICPSLILASEEASSAYSTAVANAPAEDHSELCSDHEDAYQAGLDGSCSGFDQAGLDDIQATCADAINSMTEETMDDFFEAMLAGDIDSTTAIHDQFENALESDPSNQTANFGAAFTTLVSIGQNESLESTMNSWMACLESLEMEDPARRTLFHENGSMFGIPTSIDEFSIFNATHILSYLPIINSHEIISLRGYENDCLEMSSLQDLLEDAFLSQLTDAINHLDAIVGKGFVFTITPEMMGDELQPPIHLDDTEIYIIKSIFHTLRAMIYGMIAYNVDIPYYELMEEPDSSYSFPWLAQDASFLTIREGQEQSLPNCHADLNSLLSSMESGIQFLQSDTDTEYDLIKDDESELADILVEINEARSLLNENYEMDDMIINIGNFFNNPPQNLKSILPGYTITAGPQLTWDSADCDTWMESWDVTIGGLFPEMTTESFFGDMSEEDCEDIMNLDFSSDEEYEGEE